MSLFIRKAQARGISQMDWLISHHTFSFGNYYDPAFMGFGNLRVINEDYIEPGKGFGRHPHKNMEIITYVVQGALAHKDSLGTGSIVHPGEIQRMSAGSGIEHSEYNHSATQPLHLLQIWIMPKENGLAPGYEQKPITKINNQWILIASPEIKTDAIIIHQDAELFAAYLHSNHRLSYAFKKGRQGWLQLIKGEIELNGTHLLPGDAAAVTQETNLNIHCLQDAELLFFDLN